MVNKFVEITYKDKDHARENAWFHHCEKYKIPFITIFLHGKLADVRWDYVSFPPDVDHELFLLKSNLYQAAIQICAAHGTKHSSVRYSPGVITLHKLSSSAAQAAASRLYGVVQQVVAPLIRREGAST